jgi:ketosteroid isomerase-like protein
MATRKPNPQHNNVGSPDEVEAAFYEALTKADIDKLMACWADEDEIVSVAPGGPRMVGHAAIRAHYEALFQQMGAVALSTHKRHAVHTLTAAVHNVIVRIQIGDPQEQQFGLVIATNVFNKTSQGWRMVAHHASPGTQSEVQEITEAPSILH